MRREKRELDRPSARQNLRVFPGSVKLQHQAPKSLVENLAAGSAAQIVIAVAAVLAICYFAKLVVITIFTAILLAFFLEPIVSRLERLHLPRAAGSFIAVIGLMGCLYATANFSYSNAIGFVDELPKYTTTIRDATIRFHKQAAKIDQTTQAVLPDNPADKGAVRIKQQTSWSDWLTSSVGGITEILLTISFIPFLVYFMLSWKDQTRSATVKLFRRENRRAVDHTIGGIARMLHAFLVGNLICGLFMSVVSVIAFGFFQIPYFYFLGVLSGFISLIPYLGVFLALIPPIAAGLGVLDPPDMFAIACLVVGLHVVTVSVLFPKIIGKRLKLNPLVVSMSLLMWGWIWGAMGLVLAIPITGALKIVFDHVESLAPLGAWMGD